MSKRGAAQGHEIIIKRRSRKGHEEGHGGAWKVAFADFTMAMMALFMVLWIVNPRNEMTSPSQGDMLTNPLVDGGAGVFEGTSRTPLEFDGVSVPRPQPERPSDEYAGGQAQDGEAGDSQAVRHYGSASDMQSLATLLEQIKQQLDAEANLEVEIVPQGLRIILKDDQQRFMFARGSAKIDPHFVALLGGLSAVLAGADNKLIVSGHTDSTAFRGISGYDNWNLSGDRALQARRVMVEKGIAVARVLQVTAHADGMPIRPDQPEDGANRRVEILLLTDQAEALYRQLFDSTALRARVSEQGSQLLGPAEAKPDVKAL